MFSAGPGPAGSPERVVLRDNGASVSLTWSYPSAAKGQVVISGGRSGQPPGEFQRLSPGAGSYEVYNLNEQPDYCFTVAVQGAGGRLVSSAPVCTAR